MASTRSRVHPRAGADGGLREIDQPSVTSGRRPIRKSAQTSTRLNDPDARADAIGRAAPFSAWPRDVLLRLAAAAGVARLESGTTLLFGNQRCNAITVTAEGAVVVSASSPGGRRLIVKFDDSAYAYGLAALLDGLTVPHDVVADGPVTVIRIPYAAIRAELSRLPALWESIAVEINQRGLGLNLQLQQFVFDAPLVRAAALLLGMLARNGRDGECGPVDIELRLSQERLAELLGTSRQWVTALVRELSNAGIVEWRYGGVTVLDVQGLRSLAATGIGTTGQRGEYLAGQGRVDPTAAPAGGARRSAK